MTGEQTSFKGLQDRYLARFADGEAPPIPVGVRFIPRGSEPPTGSAPPEEYAGTPWCQAVNLACNDREVVVLDQSNVGCPAAAIALGLVDAQETEALAGKRRYTDLMQGAAASPADFTNGLVYACSDTGRMDFALFGKGDSGRYQDLGVALKAIRGMKAVQPGIMKAVVAYPAEELDLTPHVVILPIKPKQALLAIQGLNYLTGQRTTLSTIGIRGVCADVTAEPFVEQRLNGSFFCLGARALGGWAGDLLALGMPLPIFEQVVVGMERSQGGFPYQAYPS